MYKWARFYLVLERRCENQPQKGLQGHVLVLQSICSYLSSFRFFFRFVSMLKSSNPIRSFLISLAFIKINYVIHKQSRRHIIGSRKNEAAKWCEPTVCGAFYVYTCSWSKTKSNDWLVIRGKMFHWDTLFMWEILWGVDACIAVAVQVRHLFISGEIFRDGCGWEKSLKWNIMPTVKCEKWRIFLI